MVYKVEKDIVEKMLEALPFLRYNDTGFFDVEEFYYSKEGKPEIPWKDPETAIVHRIVSELTFASVDFEKHPDNFLKVVEFFFDTKQVKTFENAKHYLIHGKRNDSLATEVAVWPVVDKVFENVGLQKYLLCDRLVLKVPCANLNLHITKLVGDEENLYLEITTTSDYKGLQNLIRDLKLKSEVTVSWGELAYAISVKSSSVGSN